MRPTETVRYENRLDALFAKVASIDDVELQSHWARYLCVLTSGFLEVAIRASFTEYAKQRAQPAIANYVESNLAQFNNPKMGKILEVVAAFDQTGSDTLTAAVEGKIKDHVNSIVANRHLIAHGRDVGVTIARARDWYSSARRLALLIEGNCGLNQ